jgi:hypothetical protein
MSNYNWRENIGKNLLVIPIGKLIKEAPRHIGNTLTNKQKLIGFVGMILSRRKSILLFAVVKILLALDVGFCNVTLVLV